MNPSLYIPFAEWQYTGSMLYHNPGWTDYERALRMAIDQGYPPQMSGRVARDIYLNFCQRGWFTDSHGDRESIRRHRQIDAANLMAQIRQPRERESPGRSGDIPRNRPVPVEGGDMELGDKDTGSEEGR